MLELLIAGGWLMVPILLCSVLMLAICIERFYTLNPKKIAPPHLLATVWKQLKRGELDAANAAHYAERQRAFAERLRAAIARWEKEAAPLRGMRVVAQHVTDRGVPASQVEVSLERNMQCAVKTCGHCQVGPYFACTDGPVLSWDVVDPLLTVREL